MANTIQIKRSSTASDTPSASDLAVGEIAVNTADAKLFTKHTDGSIKELGGSGGGLSAVVDDTSPQLGGNLDTNAFQIEMDDQKNINFGNLGSGYGGFINFNSTFNPYGNSNGTFLIGTFQVPLRLAPAAESAYLGSNFTVSNVIETSNASTNTPLIVRTNTGSATDNLFKIDYQGAATFEKGEVTLVSTDGGAADDPTLVLYRNSDSPATSDEIGHIIFRGNNSTSGQTADYASITTKIAGVANNLEHGELNINVLRTGSNIEVASFNYFEVRFKEPVKLDEDVNITFEGSSSNDHETVLDVVDPTADRTLSLPDETGTIATREQLSGDATNGAGFVSDEIVTRRAIATGVNSVISRSPFAQSTGSSNYVTAGSPQGGFRSQTTLFSRRAVCIPVTINGEDADTTTNIDGFVFRNGFSGTINSQTVHIGLYTMNKHGFPSQLVSRASGSNSSTTSARIVLTPTVTAIRAGRYYAVIGVFNSSNTNSTIVMSNFASSSAGGSFFQDAISYDACNTIPRVITINNALVDTSTVADVLPTSLASATATGILTQAPLISFQLGTQYTGE